MNDLVYNHLQKVLHHKILCMQDGIIKSSKEGKTFHIKIIHENDTIDMRDKTLKSVDTLAIVGLDGSVVYYHINTKPSALDIKENVIVMKGATKDGSDSSSEE